MTRRNTDGGSNPFIEQVLADMAARRQAAIAGEINSLSQQIKDSQDRIRSLISEHAQLRREGLSDKSWMVRLEQIGDESKPYWHSNTEPHPDDGRMEVEDE